MNIDDSCGNDLNFYCRVRNTVIVVAIVLLLLGTFTPMLLKQGAKAVTHGLPGHETIDSWAMVRQHRTYHDIGTQAPRLEAVSNDLMTGNTANPQSLYPSDPVVRDVLGRMNLTSVDRVNGQDRVLTPVYLLTQTLTNGSGNADFRIFHYVWRESPQHYDVEAVVGVRPSGDEYQVEIGKLTDKAIKVDMGGYNSGIIPETNATGTLSEGYVTFTIRK